MPLLSGAALLELWDEGTGKHGIDQALLLLRQVYRESSRGALAALSLGQRDALLLGIRRQLFGDRVDACTRCPSCQERVECCLSCEQLLAGVGEAPPVEIELTLDGIEVRLRAPNSHDAALAARARSVAAAREVLLERCVVPVNPGIFQARSLSDTARAEVAERLAVSDPQAEILVGLSCPGCGHAWQVLFDIASHVWTELSVQAKRVLEQVDLLARVYGWSEAEVLGLSDRRRGWYFDMALS